jgi:hypothetical protein
MLETTPITLEFSELFQTVQLQRHEFFLVFYQKLTVKTGAKMHFPERSKLLTGVVEKASYTL